MGLARVGGQHDARSRRADRAVGIVACRSASDRTRCRRVRRVSRVLVGHAKSEGLEFLYAASEQLSSARDLEGGLLALLEFARETFHADVAEIVLNGEEGESVGYRTCSGPAERSFRLEPCATDLVASLIAMGGEAGDVVMHRQTNGNAIMHPEGLAFDAMLVAAIGDGNGVAGVAVIGRQKGTAIDSFSKDEINLFETFVNHLATTLEKSRLSTSLAQLRALKQELAHQAYHDSLTGLANRLMFRDLVDNALKTPRTTTRAVLFIDLDDFKTVNDTMGHRRRRTPRRGGEPHLIERRRGGTAARLGGDEFAVPLPASETTRRFGRSPTASSSRWATP